MDSGAREQTINKIMNGLATMSEEELLIVCQAAREIRNESIQ